jgi:hypothetical protein
VASSACVATSGENALAGDTQTLPFFEPFLSDNDQTTTKSPEIAKAKILLSLALQRVAGFL